MLKNPKLRQTQKGLIAALLCLALGIAIFDAQTSRLPSPAAQQDRAEKLDKSATNKSNPNGFWETVSTDPVAAFTLALVVVGLFQAGLFFVQLGFIRESLDDAEKGVKAAQDAADAAKQSADIVWEGLLRTRRAWVGLSGPIQTINPLTFDDNGVRGTIRITVKNGGESPARGVHIYNKPSVKPFLHDDPRQFLIQSDRNSVLMLSDNMGRLLLPDEVTPWPNIEINVPRANFEIGPSETVSVWLTGYIGYRDEFDLPHATTFLFRYVADGQREIVPNGVITGQFEIFGAGTAN